MNSAGPQEEAEIVIVGGGPAGSTAAATLAALGHDVLLIDKDAFPREKPCGDGVMHPGLAVAERMGLGDDRPAVAVAHVGIGELPQHLLRCGRLVGDAGGIRNIQRVVGVAVGELFPQTRAYQKLTGRLS